MKATICKVHPWTPTAASFFSYYGRARRRAMREKVKRAEAAERLRVLGEPAATVLQMSRTRPRRVTA